MAIIRPVLVRKLDAVEGNLLLRRMHQAPAVRGGWPDNLPLVEPAWLKGIVSKRIGSPYCSGRSAHWVKVKNPNAPAVKREAEEDWDKR